MNSELKNLISTAFDAEKLAMDGIKKNYFALISDALQLVGDVPADIAGFSDLQSEINDLSKPENEQDLVAFLQQKLSSIEQLSSEKAQKILAIIVSIVSKAIELEQAFAS